MIELRQRKHEIKKTWNDEKYAALSNWWIQRKITRVENEWENGKLKHE